MYSFLYPASAPARLLLHQWLNNNNPSESSSSLPIAIGSSRKRIQSPNISFSFLFINELRQVTVWFMK
ncbi:hypothetical protein QW060_25225 [Myroides ceti]|uniref:Uncharacterized protein n=1 Tax=Paenimyroides ceti TaxID=395087 RepID=A0ABT8D061_9FLAO|nr:hypothetical protein [Paenimyroides ceti]MDN3710179.1 hypothetical protein [Paenimyroides ceti]